MRALRLAFLAIVLTVVYAAPSFAAREALYKVTCPDGDQHTFYGTYEEAQEFASIVC